MFVVDDHQLVREIIAAVLGRARGIDVVGTYADGREAVQAYRALRPDVVVMDLSMPILDGAEATSQLRAIDPDARVVLLTASGPGRDVARAVAAGAHAYVSKQAEPGDLIEVIRSSSRG